MTTNKRSRFNGSNIGRISSLDEAIKAIQALQSQINRLSDKVDGMTKTVNEKTVIVAAGKQIELEQKEEFNL